MDTETVSLKPLVDQINTMVDDIRRITDRRRKAAEELHHTVSFLREEQAVQMLEGVAQVLQAFCVSECESTIYLCLHAPKRNG